MKRENGAVLLGRWRENGCWLEVDGEGKDMSEAI